MRHLVIASSLAAPVAFLASVALMTRVSAMSCDYPQGPVLLAITIAMATLLSISGAFSFARYQASGEAAERAFSLMGATTAPLLLLASLVLYGSALAGAACG